MEPTVPLAGWIALFQETRKREPVSIQTAVPWVKGGWPGARKGDTLRQKGLRLSTGLREFMGGNGQATFPLILVGPAGTLAGGPFEKFIWCAKTAEGHDIKPQRPEAHAAVWFDFSLVAGVGVPQGARWSGITV